MIHNKIQHKYAQNDTKIHLLMVYYTTYHTVHFL